MYLFSKVWNMSYHIPHISNEKIKIIYNHIQSRGIEYNELIIRNCRGEVYLYISNTSG